MDFHLIYVTTFNFVTRVPRGITVIILQVVLVANSLPALNDVTAMELPDIVAEAAKVCS